MQIQHSHQELEVAILKLAAQAIQDKQITARDVVLMSSFFQYAKSKEELYVLCEMYLRRYPFLGDIFPKKNMEKHEEMKARESLVSEDYSHTKPVQKPAKNISFEKIEEKTHFEKLIENFASKMMKKDLALAIEIMKEAHEKNITLQKLQERFPEFKKWLEKQK